ncbi:WAT1-related protein [Vitis vinifera]|uniref:WAT1-related protein n=1 Tax=Vitis vinifera TaxID=29760 RepID=A0A438EFM1_VITVI|nr:WAT1-related protein [Vitis vinifera]
MRRGDWYRDMVSFSAMVALECTNVGLNTLYKAATLRGLNYHVFVVYAYGIAALVLLPSPFITHRCASQTMGYRGINISSPTLASAISNLVPAFTFILAVIFSFEKLKQPGQNHWHHSINIRAFVVTLYKGPPIILTPSPSISLHQPPHPLRSSESSWIIGALFLSVEYFLTPVWYIVQAHIIKEYPSEPTVVFFYNLFVSLLAAIVGLVTEPNSSVWIVRPRIALASIVCSVILSTPGRYAMKGPVYVAMFKPLAIIIAVTMGVALLGDSLYLGSVIGATIITMGFYTVMWGKAQEDMVEDCTIGSLESPSAQKAPLLQNYKTEEI